MGIKIKVKLDGKDAKEVMPKDKVAQAFHEVYSKVPKNVTKTGKTGDAKRKMMTAIALSKARSAGANVPDASGANYISRSDLHLDAGTSSGVNRASERVPYKPRPGIQGKSTDTPELKGNEREQVNEPETGSKIPLKPEGFGPSYVGENINTVDAVNRELNLVERARQVNNRTRDMRTNLGRGKPSQPTTDAGTQTPNR